MSSNPVAFGRDLATGFRAAQGFVPAYPNFRCADDRLSNGENRPIADGHQAATKLIHNGMITAKHGRTTEQLGAISGSLTLLANIVMAWNTHRIQAVIDRAPNDHPDEVLSRCAPIGHKHINMRGILTFDLARYASNLLRPATAVTEFRVSQ
jgi:Tn3 transposase DDE domain